MAHFQLTNQARIDLKNIAIYSQQKWGKAQRHLYIKQFDEAFHLLAKTPEIGINCDYIKTGYRKFPITSHIIFYRLLQNEQLQVVRILHKRMDVKTYLIES